ncbi:MAG: hypothetical protein JWN25_671 [Verrucomicrobiales bacterium]|nr:hypothetical protein [Verrucomicrobiales bacterium]
MNDEQKKPKHKIPVLPPFRQEFVYNGHPKCPNHVLPLSYPKQRKHKTSARTGKFGSRRRLSGGGDIPADLPPKGKRTPRTKIESSPRQMSLTCPKNVLLQKNKFRIIKSQCQPASVVKIRRIRRKKYQIKKIKRLVNDEHKKTKAQNPCPTSIPARAYTQRRSPSVMQEIASFPTNVTFLSLLSDNSFCH